MKLSGKPMLVSLGMPSANGWLLYLNGIDPPIALSISVRLRASDPGISIFLSRSDSDTYYAVDIWFRDKEG